MSKEAITVPVTGRAVIQRINRKLAQGEQKLVKLRGRAAEEYGTYVVIPIPSMMDVIGWGRNGPLSRRIEQYGVDPETLARELEVLAPHEVMLDQ